MYQTCQTELFTLAQDKTTQSQGRVKYLLRAVVPIVVDIHGCCDPTNDERDSTSYQIEPLITEKNISNTSPSCIFRNKEQFLFVPQDAV